MPRPASKFWPFGLYRVSGESMQPTYQPGDILIGLRWRRPRQNDIIVARHDLVLIKRLTKIEPSGYWLEGDNASASTDSRSFGFIPQDAFEATILARLARSR